MEMLLEQILEITKTLKEIFERILCNFAKCVHNRPKMQNLVCQL